MGQTDRWMDKEKEELSQSERLRVVPRSACCGQGAEGAMPQDEKPEPWAREEFNTQRSQLQMSKTAFQCYFIPNSKDCSFSWDDI